MTKLYGVVPKRCFTFGCSFTDYWWATWANIIGEFLYEKYGTEFYNYGRCGSGNQAIANFVAQCDNVYKFNPEDLVIVCWTSVARIDRWQSKTRFWDFRGNIFSANYPSNELKKIDIENLLLQNLGIIHLTQETLLKKCQSHFLQICSINKIFDQLENEGGTLLPNIHDIDQIFSGTYARIHLSFYDALWQGHCKPRNDWFDPHPSPNEHFSFCKKTFATDWSQHIEQKVLEAETTMEKLIENFNPKKGWSYENAAKTFAWKQFGSNPVLEKQLRINLGNETYKLLTT